MDLKVIERHMFLADRLEEAKDLNDLRDEALRIAVEHGFKKATPAEDVALMHSELSEALEDIRAGLPLNELRYSSKKAVFNYFGEAEGSLECRATSFINEDGSINKPVGVPSEIADVIIRALHFCGKHDIDIVEAVKKKMIYNDSRPYMHGGKKL